MGIKVKVHHTGQSGAGWSLGRLNLIGEFDAGVLPGGGGPGQVNGFTLFLLLFRLRLKYFYVTYHGIFQEVGHKILVHVQDGRELWALCFNTKRF
jgi:hypothetical protein